ncbi:hypothetical protein [Bradyrhizobium nanningense]|uniref:hypothetical protein n=1 Tax=Bradyrhizobium nanningense TaxID=1325118 RepID=UPI001FDF0FB0|nr:hypothetical protein [Bradyrhizobium nanningense]
MEVYVQVREILALFETLLNGAQLRRLLLMKEIHNLQRSNAADHVHIASRKSQPRAPKFLE